MRRSDETFPTSPLAAPAAPQASAGQAAAGDIAVAGPQARQAGGVTGAGVKIGILSDSFNLLGGAAADVAAGLLPAGGATVLEEGPYGGIDEGRAMAELIHATAPGAQLFFYTAFQSEADFGAGILALRAAGCQIIVDDITYPDEPMFQVGGPIADAVQQVVAAGADYFTAVGNEGTSFIEAAFAPVPATIAGLGAVLTQPFFGGAATLTVTIPAGDAVTVVLDWDAPYGANVADSITVAALQGATVVGQSMQSGSAPVVTLTLPQLGVDRTYALAVLQSVGTPRPGRFKLVLEGGGGIADPAAGIGSGTAIGHALVPGANTVGAVDVAATPSQGVAPVPEAYSGSGPGELLYGANGAPLATPSVPGIPDFLAPDGIATGPIDPFYGSSAAAAVAAGVAALLRQAQPSLSNGDLTTLLEDSAIPAGAPSVAGAGLIQADRAVQYAGSFVIAGSQQTVIRGTDAPCTIQSGGGGHWLVAGAGATLLQAQGNDTVQAGAGADTIDLTGASAQAYGASGAMWVRTLGGQDTVVGTTGALTVSGGVGGGVIYGSDAGANRLTAGAQKTIILAGGAGDILTGAGDGDLLYAARGGGDTLSGGAGTEILVGGAGGSNVYAAGAGSALVAPEASGALIAFGTGDATLLDGSGRDVLQFTNGQAGGFEAVYGFDPARDLLRMVGWDDQRAAVAQSVATQYDTGADSWIKFADGTVVAFVGLSHLDASSVTFG